MEKNMYEFSETIETKDDFILLLSMLREDLATNEDRWENITIDNFLFALERYCEDAGPDIPSWKNFATLFLAAKVYE